MSEIGIIILIAVSAPNIALVILAIAYAVRRTQYEARVSPAPTKKSSRVNTREMDPFALQASHTREPTPPGPSDLPNSITPPPSLLFGGEITNDLALQQLMEDTDKGLAEEGVAELRDAGYMFDEVGDDEHFEDV